MNSKLLAGFTRRQLEDRLVELTRLFREEIRRRMNRWPVNFHSGLRDQLATLIWNQHPAWTERGDGDYPELTDEGLLDVLEQRGWIEKKAAKEMRDWMGPADEEM